MNEPLVSIVLRSHNEAWALDETLQAIARQSYRNWELIAFDSGSIDGSLAMLQRAHPQHLISLPESQYNPARVLNHGMRLARSNFVIFINADATPQGRNWLRVLVDALQDPRVAAVFGRQIPRGDCRAVFAHDYERCFGPNRHSPQWEHFFSMASSGLRKDIWAQRGFDERMQYSEDDEYTRWARAQGWQVVYVPESVATHSHNYTPAQAYCRSHGEGRALAAVAVPSAWRYSWLRAVMLGWVGDACRDFNYCLDIGRLRDWPHALRIRWQQRRGRLAGFRQGWLDYRAPNAPHATPILPLLRAPAAETALQH